MRTDSGPPSIQSPSGIRTFLIADIRGFTRFSDERGDEAAAALTQRFVTLAHDQIESHRGSIVDVRGDEVLAVFDSAREAVRAAVDLQAALAEETARTSDPLNAGVGIDAGEAVSLNGGYRGRALNLAARLCARARPGEILITPELAHLAGSVEGIRFEDRGQVRLKGLSRPIGLISVVAGKPTEAETTRPISGRLEFRLLGPLEALEDGRPVTLGGPKQRLVLAHLLLAPNRILTMDELVDRIWVDPPTAARGTIHSYVSHLRHALGSDRIEGRTPGYVLHAEEEDLDSLRFEHILRRAHRRLPLEPKEASVMLAEALELWRGPALGDLADEPSLAGEIARLEELRAGALEDMLDARLAVGEHSEVLPELERLTTEYPFRERLWALLMLSRYRAGRQADALEAYRRARELLIDELGIDPSPELQELHGRILRQDPTLRLTGRPLRGYRLLERIGEGAFGVVWRALDPGTGREVAIKQIHPALADNVSFVRRFEQEAQTIARLEHPHVVPLYDYWRDGTGAYLVMRWMRGGSLEDAMADGAFDPETALDVIDDVASALSAAHRLHTVHRDVKPGNVLLDEDGNAYLSDFGIAEDLTDWREMIPASSLSYQSPEQLRGEETTPSSDIYGLGVVVQELLDGRRGLAPEVGDVIARATADDPEARYSDARELAQALRTALEPRAARPEVSAPAEVRNPYKGLRPFTEADADDFFGRDALVDRLIARLAESAPGSRFLAVVGPSGSGKSSVARAGLVPALRRGALAGSEEWFYVEMLPGADPLEELEAALLRVAVNPPPSLMEQLERDEHGLSRAVKRILPAGDAELVLIIDQFEELFTLVENDDVRDHFLTAAVTAISDPTSRVRVVATLRADFYDRPLAHPGLAELMRSRTETVLPLTPEELERSIVGPVQRVGVVPELALVAEMVADVSDRAGALPLLQYALTELFERRRDGALTLEAYREIEGVTGALARRAEELYGGLDTEERETLRQVFLRLVSPGESSEDTRRLVPRAELTSLELDRAALEHVIDLFGSHRMLSFDRDPVSRGPTVEVAHEALLREWGRLRGWIESAQEDVRMHRRLAAAAAEWEAAGRDPSFLLRGAHLDRFEAWASTSDLVLTSAESRYLHVSVDARESERAEEEARKAREASLERRSRTRLRALVAVFAVAALVASGLTVVALNQRGRARAQSRVATARELAAASLANLQVDPELSIMLALEAVQATRSADGSVLPEAEEVLHEAITSSRIESTIPGVGSIDWSPTGLVAFSPVEDPGFVELRAESGEPARSWEADNVGIKDLSFSPDGSMLATAGNSGIKLWNPQSGEIVLQLDDPLIGTSGLSFSADGRFLAALGPGQARVWDLTKAQSVSSISTGSLFSSATALSPDGSQLAFAQGTTARIYEVSTARLVQVLGGHVFNVTDVDWSPEGGLLATSELGWTVRLWKPTSGELITSLPGGQQSDWSPDGSRLVSGTEVWRIGPSGDAQSQVDVPAKDVAWSDVAFGPNQDKVMTADRLGVARLWDLGLSGDAEWLNLAAQPDWNSDVMFSPDGGLLLGSVPKSTVRVWDAVNGNELITLPGHRHPGVEEGIGVAGIDVPPDARLIATAGRDGVARVWDAASGRRVFAFVGHSSWVEKVRFSPDGSLLATASLDGTARIIDVATGSELHLMTIASTPEPAFSSVSVQFAPDGRRVLTGSWDGSVRIFETETGAELDRIEIGTQVNNLAIDELGEHIAVATNEKVMVWDLDDLNLVSTVARPAWPVAISPDGRVAFAGTQDASDGSISVWDPAEDKIVVLRGHSGAVTGVAFSPDGSRLASIGTEGLIRVWAVDIDDLIRMAHRELTRSFTLEECRQYLHVETCPPVA